MIHRNAQEEEHRGYLVIREQELTELARIPITGNRLGQSIVLHPRYVPKGIEHEMIRARVFHRGRTVDIFLDEPIEVQGKEYGILNFKGVGADADREMVIHPSLWYYFFNIGDYRWIPRNEGDSHDRFWGALTEKAAQGEYSNRVLEQFGIQQIPHLALHQIPPEIEQYIQQVEKNEESHTLSHTLYQIVRGQTTNIRIDENKAPHHRSNESRSNGSKRNNEYGNNEYVTPEKLASIDAAVVKAQLNLAKEGKMIKHFGHLTQNRLMDGSFIDLENFGIDEFERMAATELVQEIVNLSLGRILPPARHLAYLEALEKETGLPQQEVEKLNFTKLNFTFPAPSPACSTASN